MRGGPPLARADWSAGSIPGGDWPRRPSVRRGGGAHWRALRERVRGSAGPGGDRGRPGRGRGCFVFRVEIMSSSSLPCVRGCLGTFPLLCRPWRVRGRGDSRGGGAVWVRVASPGLPHTHPVAIANTGRDKTRVLQIPAYVVISWLEERGLQGCGTVE